MNQVQVAEAYSPPRVAVMANKIGLRGGWSLDLTTHDEDGTPWGSNDARMRNRAMRKFVCDKPLLLIGWPTCVECHEQHIFPQDAQRGGGITIGVRQETFLRFV